MVKEFWFYVDFFLEKMTWIRTLIPPDTPLYKQKTEKKMPATGFELQAFRLETQVPLSYEALYKKLAIKNLKIKILMIQF